MFFTVREPGLSAEMSVHLKLVSFLLPEAYLEGIERLVEFGRFQSRSELVRFAVRELIKGELWRIKAEETLRKMPLAKIKVSTH
jgi:Arc/MetJ-type ribon-helix-helix transcriptional regulator